VACGEFAFVNEVQDGAVELQQANSVGDGGAVLAGALGDVFLGEAELSHQALKRAGLLNGIKVLSLNVFDQGDFKRQLLGHIAEHGGHVLQAGPLGRTPAALAGNKLKACAQRTKDQRLDDPARTDRASKLVK
jgi:hypothetical protein